MCDTFCVRHARGMYFAKSSDRPIDEPQVVEWFASRAGGGDLATQYLSIPDAGSAQVLGSRPTWLWGFEHGINEHRVAVGNEKVWTIDDPHQAAPALLGMDLVRLALERAHTAEEALGTITWLLDRHGQGGSAEEHNDEPYWSSFLLVDPIGGWLLETSGRSWVATPVGDGAAISNRLTLTTGWALSSPDVPAGADWDAWRPRDVPTGLADRRLAATRACVRRGGDDLAPADLVAALREHGDGPWGRPGTPTAAVSPVPGDVHDDWSGVTVCMHVRDYQCTTASLVADLRHDPNEPLRVWACLGTPCSSAYLPVGVVTSGIRTEAVVPASLGDAAVWARLASRSRRAEQPGAIGAASLLATRTALDVVEAHAWAEAEALWDRQAGPDAWRASADRWDAALRDALDELDRLDGGSADPVVPGSPPPPNPQEPS